MNSTFSTVINFGMLRLLQRIHQLHVQYCLENDAKKSGIKYPHKDCHKAKDGYQDCAVNLEAPTDLLILESVNIADE